MHHRKYLTNFRLGVDTSVRITEIKFSNVSKSLNAVFCDSYNSETFSTVMPFFRIHSQQRIILSRGDLSRDLKTYFKMVYKNSYIDKIKFFYISIFISFEIHEANFNTKFYDVLFVFMEFSENILPRTLHKSKLILSIVQ